MLLPFSVRVSELKPVWDRAVYWVNCACLSLALANFMCVLFPFWY